VIEVRNCSQKLRNLNIKAKNPNNGKVKSLILKLNWFQYPISTDILKLTVIHVRWHKSLSFCISGLRPGWQGVSSPCRGWEFFYLPPHPDRLWGPPSLLSNGYQGLFPWAWSCRGVKVTTHLHLVPKSRIRGVIPPLPNTPSWHRGNFTFTLLWGQFCALWSRDGRRKRLQTQTQYNVVLWR
jgi:hypothetical protein